MIGRKHSRVQVARVKVVSILNRQLSNYFYNSAIRRLWNDYVMHITWVTWDWVNLVNPFSVHNGIQKWSGSDPDWITWDAKLRTKAATAIFATWATPTFRSNDICLLQMYTLYSFCAYACDNCHLQLAQSHAHAVAGVLPLQYAWEYSHAADL